MAITKRPNGRFRVSVRDLDGNFFEQKSFDTRRDAADYEAECISRRGKGTRAVTSDVRQKLLEDYWTEWSDECRGKVGPGWRKSQDQMWKDHVKPYLGTMKLTEISKPQILKCLNKCREKGLGDQMIIHIWVLLHSMFDAAIEIYEYRDSNPVLTKFKPSDPKTERAFLEPEEARAFLEKIRDHYLGPAIWTMVYTGMRSGEIVAVRQQDINLKGAQIVFREQWNKKIKQFTKVKNKEGYHWVPLAPPLIAYLREKLDLTKPEDFAFKNKYRTRFLPYDSLEDGLKRLCAEHKIKQLSPHELRHTCSELWIDMGASREDIRRLFNQKHAASVDPYLHKTSGRLRGLAEKFNERPTPLRLVEGATA